jgi:PmbA protein
VLFRPVPSPLPEVVTAHPAAASLDARVLNGLAETLDRRLARDGRVVRTWAERSAGRVEVANSRGVMAGYDTTMVGVGLSVTRPAVTGRLALQLHHVAVRAPGDDVLALLATEADEMLDAPVLEEPPPAHPHPVWLAPRALAVFLAPLRQSLLAQGVWSAHGAWHDRVGDRIVSEQLQLADDSLADGRPGSRPIDDDCVVTQRRTLIERGVLLGALTDLEAAARFGVPATGHARLGRGPRPWIGWSNVVMDGGSALPADLALAAKGGVLIRMLPPAAGDASHGRVTWMTPWAYKIEGDRVVGRYPRFVLRCAVYEALNRVLAVGKETRWIGGHCLPDLVLEVG